LAFLAGILGALWRWVSFLEFCSLALVAVEVPEVAAVEEEEVAGDRLIPALQLVHIP